jgi:hypothetical protein
MSKPAKTAKQWLGSVFGKSLKTISETLTPEQFDAFQQEASALMPNDLNTRTEASNGTAGGDDEADESDEADDADDDTADDAENDDAGRRTDEATTTQASAATKKPANTDELKQLRKENKELKAQLGQVTKERDTFKSHYDRQVKAGKVLPKEDANSREVNGKQYAADHPMAIAMKRFEK